MSVNLPFEMSGPRPARALIIVRAALFPFHFGEERRDEPPTASERTSVTAPPPSLTLFGRSVLADKRGDSAGSARIKCATLST